MHVTVYIVAGAFDRSVDMNIKLWVFSVLL